MGVYILTCLFCPQYDEMNIRFFPKCTHSSQKLFFLQGQSKNSDAFQGMNGISENARFVVLFDVFKCNKFYHTDWCMHRNI